MTRRELVAAGTAGVLAAVSAAGFALLALLHSGVDLFGLASALRVPAIRAVGSLYAAAAVAFAFVAYGIFARRSWAWTAAVAVNATALAAVVWRSFLVASHGAHHASVMILLTGSVFVAALLVLLSAPGRSLRQTNAERAQGELLAD